MTRVFLNLSDIVNLPMHRLIFARRSVRYFSGRIGVIDFFQRKGVLQNCRKFTCCFRMANFNCFTGFYILFGTNFNFDGCVSVFSIPLVVCTSGFAFFVRLCWV